MPFQPIHFSQLPTVGLPWIRDLHENLARGMQGYNMPEQVRQQFETKQLANALSKEQVAQAQAETPFAPVNARNKSRNLQAEADVAPQMKQAELAKTMAQAKQLEMFGGLNATGEGQQYLLAKMLEAKGDPRAKWLLENLENVKEGRRLRNEALPYQIASPVHKQFLEMDKMDKTILDPNSTPQQVENAQRTKRGLQLAAIAATSDEKTRDLVNRGENMLITIDNLDFDALAKGLGPGGQAWQKLQKGKTAFNTQSREYDRFLAAQKALGFLTKQVGQFYGTAAAEKAQEDLKGLVGNKAFLTNPRAFASEFNMIKSILQQEHDTYQQRLLYRMSELQKVNGRPEVGGQNSQPQNPQVPRRRTLNTSDWRFQ